MARIGATPRLILGDHASRLLVDRCTLPARASPDATDCMLVSTSVVSQVEGAELSVREGMDWSIHVSVLLIESVNHPIRVFLQSRGFVYHPYSGPSRLNEIWVNAKGVL